MSDLIDRQAAIEAIRIMQTYKLSEGDDMLLVDQAEVMTELMMLQSAEPEATLLHATKIVLEFIESCDGTTAWLITPDGDGLSCDCGYVEEGMRELIRYAERRTDG